MTLIEMMNDPLVNAIMQGALAAFTAGLVTEMRIKDVDKLLNMIFQVFGAMLGLIMMFSIHEWNITGIWQIVWIASFLVQLLISWTGAEIDQMIMTSLKEIRAKGKKKNT